MKCSEQIRRTEVSLPEHTVDCFLEHTQFVISRAICVNKVTVNKLLVQVLEHRYNLNLTNEVRGQDDFSDQSNPKPGSHSAFLSQLATQSSPQTKKGFLLDIETKNVAIQKTSH